jgi:hypothetical protein
VVGLVAFEVHHQVGSQTLNRCKRSLPLYSNLSFASTFALFLKITAFDKESVTSSQISAIPSSPVKLDERSSFMNDPVKSSLMNDLAALAGRTVSTQAAQNGFEATIYKQRRLLMKHPGAKRIGHTTVWLCVWEPRLYIVYII